MVKVAHNWGGISKRQSPTKECFPMGVGQTSRGLVIPSEAPPQTHPARISSNGAQSRDMRSEATHRSSSHCVPHRFPATCTLFPTQPVMAPARTHRYTSAMIPIILRIALIAGTLDIAENIIFNAFGHITAVQIFKYIASGLIGPSAFRAGAASVVLGILIHYAIALFWTSVYIAASHRLPLLIARPILCGLIYGAIVYLAMNFIVLPLSRV